MTKLTIGIEKLATKITNRFISLKEKVTITDSLNFVTRDQYGKTKGIRDVSDAHDLAADFENDNMNETYILKQTKHSSFNQQEQEIRVVNRFLPVFNSQTKKPQFTISHTQPPIDSHIDVIISSLSQSINIQGRVSDDEPWEKLHKEKSFERSGEGFKIHHEAIKRAIESKLKYPVALRETLILLLDGWVGVRAEDLEHFIKTEQGFLKDTKFKAIWFVGGVTETIKRLYP